MGDLYTKRISFTLIRNVILVGVLVGLVVLPLGFRAGVDEKTREIDTQIELLIEAVKGPAAEAAYDVDGELARKAVLGVYNHSGVASVVLVDDFGAMLANEGRVYSEDLPKWLVDALAGWRHSYDVPLEWGGVDVGRLAVSLNTPGLARDLLQEMTVNAARAAGAFFMLAALLVGIFHMTLTRPLLSINRDLSRLDPSESMGGRVTVPERHEHDEIGLLAGSVNQLFERIEEDITRRKRTEIEIRRAKSAAEEANKSKNEFLANMSHEVRTPLNAILGMTELTLQSELGDEQRKNLEMVKESGKTLLRVMNDILDLSKVDAGILVMEQEKVDPVAVVEQAVSMFEMEAGKKGIELAAHLGEGVPRTVLGDGGRLRQVMFNLVGNAVKFTEQGRVLVSVDRMPDDGQSGFTLKFSVSDSGPGIPGNMRGKIFESFSQIDGTYSRKHQGAGLGLAIVNRFVNLMGGSVALESELGKGSSFSFALNMPEVSSLPDDSEAPFRDEDFRPLNGLKVLLAEDNPVNRVYAAKLLEGLDMEVTAVEDGNQAVEQLKNMRFDLAVLDIQMPGMDGLAVANVVRNGQYAIDSKMPLVALTAHAMKGDREKFLKSGMDDYVAKPVDEAELKRVLVRVLAKNARDARLA